MYENENEDQYEKETVRETLEENLGHSPCLEEMKKDLFTVVDALYTKKQTKAHRAKDMVVLLHAVLTAECENKITEQCTNTIAGEGGKLTDEQVDVLLRLYSLSKAEDDCRATVALLLKTFAGRFASLVRENAFALDQQLKLATNDPTMHKDIEALRENARLAAALMKNVEKFVAKHRVGDSNVLKLKIRG